MKQFLIVILILLAITVGCTDSLNSYSDSKNHAEIRLTNGYYQSSGLELMRDPPVFNVHVEALNTGNQDANNVQVDAVFKYGDSEIARQTIYFGKVEVGRTVVKDVKVFGSRALPSNYDSKAIVFEWENLVIS